MTITEANPREAWLERVSLATSEDEAFDIAAEHPEWCPPGFFDFADAPKWTVTKGGGNCGADKPFAVMGADGKQDSCHATQAEASARCAEMMKGKAGPPAAPGKKMPPWLKKAEAVPVFAAEPGKPAGGGGGTFVAVLALQGVPTSDGRMLSENMRTRDLPIPLMVKFQGSHGNDMPAGSEFAGRIEEIEVIDRRIWGKGTFDTSPAGQEAQRHVTDQMLRWVSVDLGAQKEDITHMIDSNGSEVTYFDTYEIMAATMVATPAFQDAVIWMEGADAPGQASKDLPPKPELTEQEMPDLLEALLGSAGEIPAVPPREWFDEPTEEQLRGAGGCFVTDEGRIFGTIHVEGQCHVGSPMGQCVTVGGGTYQNFLLNALPTTDGRVQTGPLLFAPDHADTRRPDGSYVNAATAMAYYSNVGVAKADVACGDTEIDGKRVTWYSGALRPDISSDDLRTLHGSVVSGDWRPIGGKQEMISLMAVNAPGFPQLLASVAASGDLMAVIASAAGPSASGEPCENCGGRGVTAAAKADPVLARLAAIEDQLAAIYMSVAPMRATVIADLEAAIHPS